MAVSKFGQYVLLQVHDKNDKTVFESDSLKINFDVRIIADFSRAKITICNLNQETIQLLMKEDSHYVTVWTSLHGSERQKVIDGLYVSNALEELKLPQSEFSIYAYSKLKAEYLEKPVDLKVTQPSLKKVIIQVLDNAGYTGQVEFKHFPSDILSYVNYRPTRREGTLLSVLKTLGKEYGFTMYTDGNKFTFMYKAKFANAESTELFFSKDSIKLDTSNMRANPRLGAGQLDVTSNLDPRIKPAVVLDITDLVAVDIGEQQDTLELARNLVRKSIAGKSKYQASEVQHKGSNWEDVWLTQVVAYPPTQGTTMPTDKWWT